MQNPVQKINPFLILESLRNDMLNALEHFYLMNDEYGIQSTKKEIEKLDIVIRILKRGTQLFWINIENEIESMRKQDPSMDGIKLLIAFSEKTDRYGLLKTKNYSE